MPISDDLRKIGEIKLGETGFSTKCNEAHALEILKNEACALNADIVNISEETRPDSWSTCYRCRAEFYVNTNKDMVLYSDLSYRSDQVKKRVKNDRYFNTAVIVSSIVAGIVLILFLSN